MALLMIFVCRDNVFSQDIKQKPSRQSSVEAFSKGDFETALGGFSELLDTYPRDPLYKYYSGVCLVKLNRDPVRAVELLSGALQGTAVVRTIPSDARYWLGRAQQMSGNFSDALNSYKMFASEAGKKTARDLGIDDLIQQCNAGKGQINESQIVAEKKPDKIALTRDEGIESVKDTFNTIKAAEQKTLPDDIDRLLSEALIMQVKADSLRQVTDRFKAALEKSSAADRNSLRVKIAETEALEMNYQKKADQKYSEVQDMMNSRPFTEDKTVVGETVIKADSVPVKKLDTINVKKAPEVKIDSALRKKITIKPDKGTIKDSSDMMPKVKNEPVIIRHEENVFAVFMINPKPVYKPGEKIPVDQKIPPGLIYRIQVAVFRNPVSPDYFKGITPVFGFRVTGTDKTGYYAGMFRRLNDANRALTLVRQKGFKDAFVVSIFGGKAVSAERAALLEKEWGKKPFDTYLKSGEQIPADTIPPTLSFRVEVMRSPKAVKAEAEEGMKKFAGNRELSTVISSEGTYIYLIGAFITYDSAAEFSDLLVRNGYRDAKVTAWLGKKEIPVETARQLFDMP